MDTCIHAAWDSHSAGVSPFATPQAYWFSDESPPPSLAIGRTGSNVNGQAATTSPLGLRLRQEPAAAPALQLRWWTTLWYLFGTDSAREAMTTEVSSWLHQREVEARQPAAPPAHGQGTRPGNPSAHSASGASTARPFQSNLRASAAIFVSQQTDPSVIHSDPIDAGEEVTSSAALGYRNTEPWSDPVSGDLVRDSERQIRTAVRFAPSLPRQRIRAHERRPTALRGSSEDEEDEGNTPAPGPTHGSESTHIGSSVASVRGSSSSTSFGHITGRSQQTSPATSAPESEVKALGSRMEHEQGSADTAGSSGAEISPSAPALTCSSLAGEGSPEEVWCGGTPCEHEEWRSALAWRVVDADLSWLDQGWDSWAEAKASGQEGQWVWPGRDTSNPQRALAHRQLAHSFDKILGTGDDAPGALVRLESAKDRWTTLLREREECIYFTSLLLRGQAMVMRHM